MASTTYRFGPRSLSTTYSWEQGMSQEQIDAMVKEFETAIHLEFCGEVAHSFLKAKYNGGVFGTGPVALDGPTVNTMIETILSQYLQWLNTEGFIADENFITKE